MAGKLKVAVVSLTSCEGCQIALLDLGQKFFDFLKKVELLDFHLIEENPMPKGEIDIVFVEGNPITKEDLKILKKARKQAKILAVLGNCAALGGIPEMKNYQAKEKTIRYIYKNQKDIANPDIKEVDNFVKVDFTIPGCPINGEEFLRLSQELIKGKMPEIPQKPVCSECPHRAKESCFLIRKEPCLGPISLAGCNAVCAKSEFPCYGCRGLLDNLKPQGFLKRLEKMKSRQDIEQDLEIFGLRDMIK